MYNKFPPNLPHYFPVDCFGGSSDLAGTGSTLFSGGLFWRRTTVLYTKYVHNTKNYFPPQPKN